MLKPNLTKTTNFLDQIEFENDFGQEPIGVGRFTEDKAVVGVFSMALAFVGWTITPPLAVIVALVWWNDVKSLDGGSSPERKKRLPVVDTVAEEVYDEDEYYYEEPVTPAQEPRRSEKQTPRRESTRKVPTQSSESAQVKETPNSSEWTWGEDGEPDVQDTPRRSRKHKSTEPHRESNIPIPQLPQVTSRAKKELIQRLKEECPALLKMVKSHPIRAVGIQRTGKTTLVKKLTLLRMVLLPNHRAIASTPHNESGNRYPDVFETVGLRSDGSRDYVSIKREWDALADRIEASEINSITTIWDEFGLLDKAIATAIQGGKPDIKAIQEAQDEICINLTSCLRETMKFGEYPIFIVHGETAKFLPGSKGLVTVFLDGTVRVETIGESVEGDDGLEMIRPTGKFNVTWLDGSKEFGQIPEWLTEEYLLELLGNPVVQKPQKNNPEDFTVSAGLNEPLRTLLQKTKEHGDWITVREIQRLNMSALQGKTANQIHQHLGLLADMKLGEIDEENKSDSAVRFRSF
jgi:hypothetical protein